MSSFVFWGLRGVKLCFLFSADEADTGFQAENKRQSLTFWTETGPHLNVAVLVLKTLWNKGLGQARVQTLSTYTDIGIRK